MNITWYYAKRNTRARTEDNSKDRTRTRTKAKHMIVISEVVNLHTKSIVKLILPFLPPLLRFVSIRLETIGVQYLMHYMMQRGTPNDVKKCIVLVETMSECESKLKDSCIK